MSITTLVLFLFCSLKFSPRIDEINTPSFLYCQGEDEVLDAEVGDVAGPGDVEVLEDGAVLPEDGEDLVVADAVEDHVAELLHLLCGEQ